MSGKGNFYDNFGMGGSSPFGDADLFAGHLLGVTSVQSEEIGELNGELRFLTGEWKQLRAWFIQIGDTASFLSADDTGLRAVIRTMAKDLRQCDAFNKLLVKDHRDRIYGAAHSEFIEAFKKNDSKIANGWEQQLANRHALYCIIKELDVALMAANPQAEILTEEGKFAVYREHFNSEIDKYDRKQFNRAGITKEGLGLDQGLSGVGLRKKAEREGGQ